MAEVGSPVPGNGRTGELTGSDGDWAAQAADAVERAVSGVRGKTAGPALTVARGVVYGTFAALLGVAALVLIAIASVRLVDNYLPDSVFGEHHTWAAHLIIGFALVVVGGALWVRRHPPRDVGT